MAETKPLPSGLRQPIGSDLILAVRMVVQSLGRRSAHRADRIDAEIMAERIVQALRGLNYIILQKPPRPIAPAFSLPQMGKSMRTEADPGSVEVVAAGRLDGKNGRQVPEPPAAARGPEDEACGLDPNGQVRSLQSSRPYPHRPPHQEARAQHAGGVRAGGCPLHRMQRRWRSSCHAAAMRPRLPQATGMRTGCPRSKEDYTLSRHRPRCGRHCYMPEPGGHPTAHRTYRCKCGAGVHAYAFEQMSSRIRFRCEDQPLGSKGL